MGTVASVLLIILVFIILLIELASFSVLSDIKTDIDLMIEAFTYALNDYIRRNQKK